VSSRSESLIRTRPDPNRLTGRLYMFVVRERRVLAGNTTYNRHRTDWSDVAAWHQKLLQIFVLPPRTCTPDSIGRRFTNTHSRTSTADFSSLVLTLHQSTTCLGWSVRRLRKLRGVLLEALSSDRILGRLRQHSQHTCVARICLSEECQRYGRPLRAARLKLESAGMLPVFYTSPN
jgi:hypothetical protein